MGIAAAIGVAYSMLMVTFSPSRVLALFALAPLLFWGGLSSPLAVTPTAARAVADETVIGEAARPQPPGERLVLSLSTPTPRATPTPSGLVAAMAEQSVQFVVRARKGGPVVRSAPSETASPLSGLYYDTYLPVLSQQPDAAGVLWYQVRLWGVLNGWIRADQTEPGDPPLPTPRPPPPPAPSIRRPGRSAIFPLTARARTNDWVNFRSDSDVDSERIDLLAPGTLLNVQAWQTDDESSAWYRVSTGGVSGWVWSGAVDLLTPNPAKVNVGGKPIWAPIAGKGMWMPVPLLDMANPDAVVAAARALGLTHVYLEAGSSQGGFYGRDSVDRLLPAAHRANIKVIGWVLTSLNDLPRDISVCTEIATYRTSTGDQLDGIAPDIEDNLDASDVSAFSQILRAKLGPNRLIVGVIFPAGTWIGRQHPVADILGRSFNALAPMDYWHDAQRAFSPALISDFIRQSVVDIHAAVDDPQYPVAVIGQTYDYFSRNGAGPNNPTGEEISAALEAAKQAGAVGVSLFQWGTTTPSEWDALRLFRWHSGG